ncbi:hypothetical protein SBA3_2430004 [Candidatus Sulfopaludibacter sp. SbA3]|nr:hypothetical protein SBA3_2430004 [Candidatus Sulfopaludibacter sp. SbA3]
MPQVKIGFAGQSAPSLQSGAFCELLSMPFTSLVNVKYTFHFVKRICHHPVAFSSPRML